MNDRTRKLLPILIFGVLLAVALVIRMNPPESQERRSFRGPAMTVETQVTQPVDYTVMLESYGTVQPRTRSVLTAQVGGQIIAVDEKVRDGGFFEKGDVLVEIDARDYAADVRIAQAALADAESALAEAEARTNQAREDWERLGNEGDPPGLVLRIPQLEAAKARVASAESALAKARLDLDRTRIVAPFAGRILRKFVDVGQVVPPNSRIAEIYATDFVEIRLPLRNRDLPYIDLPESYRFAGTTGAGLGRVIIESDLMGEVSWEADLVRTESAIDDVARQLHVIAQIDDPFGRGSEGRALLKIGQYVTARLEGRTLEDAIVIPNNTIYQGSYVYTVTEGVLRRRDIDIAWQNDTEAVIGAGLEAGDQLVVTPLGQVTSGIRVSIMGEEGETGAGQGPRSAGQ